MTNNKDKISKTSWIDVLKSFFCCYVPRDNYIEDGELDRELDRELRFYIQRGDTVKSLAERLYLTEQQIKTYTRKAGCLTKDTYEDLSGKLTEYEFLIPGTSFIIPKIETVTIIDIS